MEKLVHFTRLEVGLFCASFAIWDDLAPLPQDARVTFDSDKHENLFFDWDESPNFRSSTASLRFFIIILVFCRSSP